MKKSTLIKFLCLSLSLSLCFGNMVACKKSPTKDPNNSDPTFSSEISSDTTTESQVTDSSSTPSSSESKPSSSVTSSGGVLSSTPGWTGSGKLANDKVVDMKGYTFTILSPLLPTKLNKNATLFEELLFERIAQVEKQYNCKIRILNSPYPDMETIKTYILAGKKVADLLELYPSQMIAAKELGYIVPWDTCELINPKDARWAESYTKLGKYDGKQYGLQFYRPEEVRYCVVFNKNLVKKNGTDPNAIYNMVNKGTWTFDEFQKICVANTKDTNGDGKMDTYGFTGIPNYISWGLISANGGSVLSTDSKGKVYSTFTDKKVVTALNYYNNWVNKQKIMYTNNATVSSSPWDTVSAINPIDYFLEGNCAFLLYESWVLNQQIKPRAKFDYGMLPYPKGPNATDYSCYANNARLMCLTSTNKSADKTAIIFNALARPVDDVLDYSSDVQADYFQKNDKDSINVYKLLLEKGTYDKGMAVDSLANEMNSVFASTIFGRDTTPSAKLNSIGNKFDDAINSIFNK